MTETPKLTIWERIIAFMTAPWRWGMQPNSDKVTKRDSTKEVDKLDKKNV